MSNTPVTPSSGNVFADLGLPHPELRLALADAALRAGKSRFDAAALARHTQSCQREGLSLDELRALAGKYDRYPVHTAAPNTCVGCGAPLTSLATYCNAECQRVAQKRSYRDGAKRRQPEEIAGYSYPIPTKGQ